MTADVSGLVDKLPLELVLEASLKCLEGRQRFAAGVHLDVQVIGKPEMLEIQQLEGDYRLPFVHKPRIGLRDVSETLVNGFQHD
ncbi:hypothetical protein D3C84_1046740 [compost metagenome]